MSLEDPIYITTAQGKKRWNDSRLAHRRVSGFGPPFVKLPGGKSAKVLYPVKEGDEWYASHMRRSTSEYLTDTVAITADIG